MTDPLALSARTAGEDNADDAEIAATVLTALIAELPEHFGPDARAAYTFWLRNRIAALRTGRPFHRWITTGSYLHNPDLLMVDPP